MLTRFGVIERAGDGVVVLPDILNLFILQVQPVKRHGRQ